MEIWKGWKGWGELINDHSSSQKSAELRVKGQQYYSRVEEWWSSEEQTMVRNSTIQKIIYDFSFFVLKKNMIYYPSVITREMKSLKIKHSLLSPVSANLYSGKLRGDFLSLTGSTKIMSNLSAIWTCPDSLIPPGSVRTWRTRWK